MVLYCDNAKTPRNFSQSRCKTQNFPCRWENHEWTTTAQARITSEKFLLARAAWAVRKFFSTVVSYEKIQFSSLSLRSANEKYYLFLMESVLPAGHRSCVLNSASAWWLHHAGTQLRMRSNRPVEKWRQVWSSQPDAWWALQRLSLILLVIISRNVGHLGLFGNEWETARCMGKVIRVTKDEKWCLVQWSIDGTVKRAPASTLTLEAPPPAVQVNDSPHLSLLSSLLSSFAWPFLVPLSKLCNYTSFLSFLSFFGAKPLSMHKTR